MANLTGDVASSGVKAQVKDMLAIDSNSSLCWIIGEVVYVSVSQLI